MDGQKGAAAGRHAEGELGVEVVGEHHTVATHRHGSLDLKGTAGVTVDQSLYCLDSSFAVRLYAKCSI